MRHVASDLLERLIELAGAASAAVIQVYERRFEVSYKDDGSPLTEADMASHRLISEGLGRIEPDVPVISEENATAAAADELRGRRFWLVDPLDGTKEFVKRNGEFTVNIALIGEDGAPRLGVVSAPTLGSTYAGIVGEGAWRIEAGGQRVGIRVDRDVSEGWIVVGSRSHRNARLMEEFLEGRRVRDFIAVGSSLKFCRLAEGAAHLYPRFGRTMEWDTAAGHAVLLASGGAVETFDGKPLAYAKPGLDNPHFVARTCPL